MRSRRMEAFYLIPPRIYLASNKWACQRTRGFCFHGESAFSVLLNLPILKNHWPVLNPPCKVQNALQPFDLPASAGPVLRARKGSHQSLSVFLGRVSARCLG